MNLTVTLVLLVITALIAILPGFAIMSFFNGFVPVIPSHVSLIQYTSYIVKVAGAFVFGLVSTILYADLVFPLVMFLFAIILRHYSGENVQQQSKIDAVAKSL